MIIVMGTSLNTDFAKHFPNLSRLTTSIIFWKFVFKDSKLYTFSFCVLYP